MFTGIIGEKGIVRGISRERSGARLKISCDKINRELKTGDSVAVNGVCLSVTDVDDSVVFDVVRNTLAKTGLKRLKTGDTVNLESAMRLGDKVNGHMVTGHVDGERAVRNNMDTSEGWIIDIAAAMGDEKYLVPKGAVAVDGVSLTVGKTYGGFFRAYLIPLTLEETTLKLKKTGDYVNVEFDIMAKYSRKVGGGSITEETLRRTGFLD